MAAATPPRGAAPVITNASNETTTARRHGPSDPLPARSRPRSTERDEQEPREPLGSFGDRGHPAEGPLAGLDPGSIEPPHVGRGQAERDEHPPRPLGDRRQGFIRSPRKDDRPLITERTRFAPRSGGDRVPGVGVADGDGVDDHAPGAEPLGRGPPAPGVILAVGKQDDGPAPGVRSGRQTPLRRRRARRRGRCRLSRTTPGLSA